MEQTHPEHKSFDFKGLPTSRITCMVPLPQNLQSDAAVNQLLKCEVEERSCDNSFERSWEAAGVPLCQGGTVKNSGPILMS